MNSDTYPLDPYGIKQIDITKWLEEYNAPAKYDEFQAIFEKVYDIFIQVLSRYDKHSLEYDFLIVNYKISLDLALQIFFFLRLNRLKQQGFNSVLSRGKRSIEEEIDSLYSSFFSYRVSFSLSSTDKLRYLWRLARMNFGKNKLIGSGFFNCISSPSTYIAGDRNAQEVVAFCKENNLSPIVLQPRLMNRKPKDNHIIQQGVEKLNEFIDDFLRLCSEKIPESQGFINERIRTDLSAHLYDVFNSYLGNLGSLGRYKLKGKLMVTAIGTIYHRLFCSAWRRNGGEVYSFTHGNNYINSYKPHPIFMMNNLSVSDFFVTSSTGEADLVKNALKDYNPGIEINCQILSLTNNMNRELYNSLQKHPLVPGTPKKVMLIGIPMGIHYPPFHPGHYTEAFLHLEIKLIQALKESGYYVVYKSHPDTLSETSGLFENFADKVLTGYFESEFKLADCFLFTAPGSTTFGFSLLTNRPIVLLNIEGYPWHPEVLPLLKKRCSVINAPRDLERDIITFDKKELIEAIENSFSNINYEILEKFAF